MNNMNRGLFGSRNQGDDDGGRRILVSDEGYERDPQDYCERRKKEDPVDVVVKVEPSDRHCDKRDRCRCRRAIDVALNAATGGAGPLPIIAVGGLTQTIPVVSVTIDAECICDPSILLTFTTLISLPVAVTATLSFAVLRTSVDNGTPITVGPGFTFSTTVAALESDSFAFQLFDSDLEPGTYTYTVVLTPSTVTTAAGVTLLNSTLSALAVSGRN